MNKRLFLSAVPGPEPRTAPVREESKKPAGPAVGFLPFANLTRKPEYDYLCDTIPESVQTIISRNTNIVLIDSRKPARLLPAGNRAVTNYSVFFDQAGISQLITGSFVETGDMISVNLKVVDTRTSAVLFGTSVNGTAGKGLFSLIDRITGELNRFYSPP